MTPQVHLLSVFAAGPRGGNPAPIVPNAAGMSDADMREVARAYRHESGFVLPAPVGSDCDFALRFWAPSHEMETCGHATVGAVWLLDQLGKLPRSQVRIWTRSGVVEAHVADAGGARHVEITQPQGRVEPVPDAGMTEDEILSALGVTTNELAPLPIQNACTSRVKTLVPLKSTAVLDGLRPDFRRVERVCARIGSTGLYPYAWSDLQAQVFDGRQFPKSSGYPEDAATGIAAAALAFGLLANGMVETTGKPVRVRQGRAMGRPSEITVRFRSGADSLHGCWLSGSAHFETPAKAALAE